MRRNEAANNGGDDGVAFQSATQQEGNNISLQGSILSEKAVPDTQYKMGRINRVVFVTVFYEVIRSRNGWEVLFPKYC